jgi:hypothetical protein
MRNRIGWFGVTMIFIGVVAMIATLFMIRANCCDRWKVKSYEAVELPNPPSIALNCSNSDLMGAVDNLFNVKHFVARTGKRMANMTSSSCLFRIVFLDKDATGEDLVILYAHELAHLKFFRTDDTYISFKAFQMLYESGNNVLRNVAERYAYEVVTQGVSKGTEYDCGYYILEYLKGV